MRKRQRYRTRRGKPDDQYFGLSYTMARSPAFRMLSGAALKVFIELRTRFNGGNNGDLSLSLDEAARLLGIGKGTAQRAFVELAEKGFIAMTKKGQWYGRRATTWRVSDKGWNGDLPTYAWKHWTPQRPPPDLRPEVDPVTKPTNGSASLSRRDAP
jgi:hypothetical protein